MFSKILIANRGEIACRIIKTARRMGISTVAVYSAVDRDARHTLLADERVAIGPAAANASYLNIENILTACRETGVEALHPGYGFLSEQARFAEQLADHGIVFIGPKPTALTSMGDKMASKRLAQQAGVNTIPGHTEIVRDEEHAVQIARDIGYPVMIKASAGGGGKGMRRAWNDEECRDGYHRATSEARSSFGDDRLLIEKYIEQPRHIEIQIIADQHGNFRHLGERECSLQRRQQKVIEEAPSPFLDPDTRERMGQQAIALARAVDYESVGTVEFIVDQNRQFYFLEMNTRLQVEHPVTEMVTGLDLVEWMIRIANGEPLPFAQSEVRWQGWSVEARVYAEDPFRNFLPSTGRLVRYLPPPESDHVRVDTGVDEGADVSMYYDPMIAKVITHAKTRDDAISSLRDALNRFCIRGPSHNISFLAALVNHPRFRTGDLDTNLIADEYPHGFHPTDAVHDEPTLLAAIAASMHRRYLDRAFQVSGPLRDFEPHVPEGWMVVMGGQQIPIEIRQRDGGHDVLVDGKPYRVVSDWQFGQPLFQGAVNGTEICLQVERNNLGYRIDHWGTRIDVMVLSKRAAELLACIPAKPARVASNQILSPMPGLLSQVLVDVGHEIKAGQSLVVVEAMKMENVLSAERDGKIAKLLASVGDTLAVDQPILEFEKE